MPGGPGSESHEVVIDGKLMNIGSRGSRPRPGQASSFQINFGADLGPGDPGSAGLSDHQARANAEADHDHAALCPARRDSYEAAHPSTPVEQDSFTPIENNAEPISGCSSKKGETRNNRWNLKRLVKIVLIIVLVTAYNGYMAYALHYHISTGRDLDWCGGLGFLIIVTLITYISLLYFNVLKRFIPGRKVRLLVPTKLITFVHTTPGRWLLNISVLVAISTFLIIDTKNDRQRLISAAGVFVIIFLGALFSTSRKDIVWRHVVWGLSLQFLFGLLILRWKFGKMFFDCIGDKVCVKPKIRSHLRFFQKTPSDIVPYRHYSGRYVPRIH